MIEVTIQHPPDEVKEAVVQFCARRGYRLTQPWYLEGMRIEAPERNHNNADDRGFWATVMSSQSLPRIDVDIKKRRGTSSRVKITLGDNAESTRLAYELQAYLHDDRAYEAACPPICPNCGNNVPNPVARYCGRCGHKFAPHTTSTYDHVLGPPPVGQRENEPGQYEADRVLRPPQRADSAAETESGVTIVEALDVDFDHLDESTSEPAQPIAEPRPAENTARPERESETAQPPTRRETEAVSVEEDERAAETDTQGAEPQPPAEENPVRVERESAPPEPAAAEPDDDRNANEDTTRGDIETEPQNETDEDSEPDDDAQPTRRLLAEE